MSAADVRMLPPECETVADALPLLHDRELGPAETARVEAHLAGCPACQREAVRFERLSSLLKAWDEPNQEVPVPGLRVHNGVLARVAEQGARRRAEDRLVRRVRFATAASVLLVLSTAVTLGLLDAGRLGGGEARPSVLWTASEAPVAPWPADVRRRVASRDAARGARGGEIVSPESLASPLVVREPLRFDPLPPAPAGLSEPIGSDDRTSRLLARVEVLRNQKDQLSARLGGAPLSMWAGVAGQPRVMFMPSDLYASMDGSGFFERLAKWDAANARTGSSSSPTPTAHPSTHAVAAVLAPLPMVADPERRAHSEAHLVREAVALRDAGILSVGALRPERAAPVPGIGVLESGPAGALVQDGLETIEPLAAQAGGWLRFEEVRVGEGRRAGSADLIAIVKGTGRPIFLPDGHLLTGGERDRCVAEPVWLPACTKEEGFYVRCRFVQEGRPRAGAPAPQLTPWVAGPTVRALLRAGVDDETLLDEIRRQLKVADRERHDLRYGRLTLLDLPRWIPALDGRAPFHAAAPARRDRIATEVGRAAGFVAEVPDGAQGALMGVEWTRLTGTPAQQLLARLYLGYELEALVRLRSRRAGQPALAALADAGAAYRVLGRAGPLWVEPGQRPAGVEVLTRRREVHANRSGVQVAALAVDGTVIGASVTAATP